MECRTAALVRSEIQLRYTELVDPDMVLYPTVPADLPDGKARVISRVLEKMEAFATLEEAGGGRGASGLVLPGTVELARDPADFDPRATLVSGDHCGVYRLTDGGRGIAVKYRALRLLPRQRVVARVRQVLANHKNEKLVCVAVGTADNGVEDVAPTEIPGHILIDARARAALAEPGLRDALRRWVAAADQTGRVAADETVEVVVEEVDMMTGAVLFRFADSAEDDDSESAAEDSDAESERAAPQIRQLEIAEVGDDLDASEEDEELDSEPAEDEEVPEEDEEDEEDDIEDVDGEEDV